MKQIKRLEFLKTSKDQFNEIGKKMMTVDDGRIFPVDLLALGIINRAVTVISGFCEMMKKDNYLCAAPLVRIHLDSLLQFYAVFIVENPHDYSGKKMDGKQTNNLKDREGYKMKEGYLKSKFIEENKDFEWINDVYKETSKFVHFSDKHIFSNMKIKENNEVTFVISDKVKTSEKSEKEIIECMIQITDGLFKYLIGWVETKRIEGEKRNS